MDKEAWLDMKKKTFDCARMKWDIQRKLREEERGLSLVERQSLMRKKILEDPILGPWFRRVRGRQAAYAMVAEGKTPYTR